MKKVKKTLECTTWLGSLDPRRPLRRHFKPRLPHAGLTRLTEAFSMDTVYPQGKNNEIVGFEGFTCAQIFLGLTSNLIFLSLMHTESEGPDALLDFIRYVGCPKRLHSDWSKMQ